MSSGVRFLIPDGKGIDVTSVFQVFHFHAFDPSGGRSGAAPPYHLVDIFGVSFEDRLDPAVAGVTYPSRNPCAQGGPPGFAPEEDTLYTAADHHMGSCLIRRHCNSLAIWVQPANIPWFM